MGISPSRSRLYRRTAAAVICVTLIVSVVNSLHAQSSRSDAKSKGPRATALLQLPENGKPRLIPVCILIDGRFFDAGIYKANPVPMALAGGTVYEAQRAGEPIGLFTVEGVLQQQQTKAWIAEGDWEAAGASPKKPTALQAEARPREQEDAPPTLRRPGKTPTETKPSDSTPGKTTPPDSKPPQSTAPETTPSTSSGAQSTASANPSAAGSNAPPAANNAPPSVNTPAASEENDPNRPHLRRGAPPPTHTVAASSKKPATATTPISAAVPATPKTSSVSTSPPAAKTLQLIPAISDAAGPQPRPYTFDMKPEEEQAFRKRMLALVTIEIAKQTKQPEPAPQISTSSRRSKAAAKPTAPQFDDVKLRVFDVATNNEPILVLSAKASAPPSPKSTDETTRDYYVTVVARSDFNGELHKLLSSVTDNQHLDVSPRLELIDAVDADGDGRGELLFRELSDAGTAYVVYRVTPDQLWALFEGSPSR